MGTIAIDHPISSPSTAWHALKDHYDGHDEFAMHSMFSNDPDRFERFSVEAAGLFLDYSKNRIDDRIVAKLIALAQASGLEKQREAMFAGERINITEDRAVLHTALRDRSLHVLNVDGQDIMSRIHAARDHAYRFCERIRSGEWHGYTGKPITDIVNIGIGGSDLGPRMCCEALKPFAHPRLRMHFVANIDGDELSDVLKIADPTTTLFIIASKTFTTIETLTNAHSARAWLLAWGASTDQIAKHFVAVSTNVREVAAFGIDPANMFEFWDWVGGRFSLWSSIGLPIMLSIGPGQFDALLDGAHAMDRHFCDAPFESNMPVLLALVGIWYRNVCHTSSHAVLPYAAHLHRLPAYLQQLEMESNGKSVSVGGSSAMQATCPVVWGEPGTNGQHAFYQLLHQGTDWIPIDFIAAIEPLHSLHTHHRMLLANCFAQSSALMMGKTTEEVIDELVSQGLPRSEVERLAPHQTFPGNRPSNTIMMARLDPTHLGALVALYEHKVFVQGTIWGVNSFDQWGVELGKVVAKRIEKAMDEPALAKKLDSSTAGLLRLVRQRSAKGKAV